MPNAIVLGRRTRYRRLATALAAAALVVATGCSSGDGGADQPDHPAGSSASDTLSIPDVVDKVQPSVVTVLTPTGGGSGVVYDDDGTVITNEHVVRGQDRVTLAYADGEEAEAEVVATDTVVDLAVLRSSRTDAPPARFDTALPRVGAQVIAIGSPLGFTATVTAGIISGLHRSIPGSAQQTASLVDLIQTDAAISPGNSGGALVDLDGDVIGISEAYIPPQAGAVSLGFAIPAATVVEVVEELREDGTVDHAFLGLQPTTLTPSMAQRFGLTTEAGVVVLSVVDDGPADRAGIKPGDVILAVDGVDVDSAEQLLATLRNVDPDDELALTVIRDAQRRAVTLTVGRRPMDQPPH